MTEKDSQGNQSLPPVVMDYGHRRGPTTLMPMHWLLGVVLGLTLGVVMESFLVPLRPARELRKRISCATNLHGISRSVLMYRQDHRDADPPDLADLVKGGLISSKSLVCPAAGTTAATKTPPISQTDLEGHCDYVLVTGLGSSAPDDLARAFELPVNHRQEGTQTAFQWASVQWMDLDEGRSLLQRTNDVLALRRRGMP